MSQHELIDDVEGREITAEYVNQRVDDWLKRLDSLFKQIEAWADANGWTTENGAAIEMREELMDKFGVAGRVHPTLSVRNSDGALIWIRPKGLWVIGANGRVDLFSRNGAFVLVDIAEAFQRPQWILHHIGKGDGRPFRPGQLANMV